MNIIKKLHLVILLFCQLLTSFAFAQKPQSKDIDWDKNLDWSQIKSIAKKNRKYIFIDCFATWCGPCKLMDRYVYTNDAVRAIIRDKFISIKLQFDTTTHDNKYVKSWHNTANAFNKEFRIAGFPSFLFFNADGELILQDVGYKSTDEFLRLIADVQNPAKQYPYLLRRFNNRQSSYDDLRKLAIIAKDKDKDLANQIVNYYLANTSKDSLLTVESIKFLSAFSVSQAVRSFAAEHKTNVLDKKSPEKLTNVEDLTFIAAFSYLLKSKDSLFQLLLKNGKLIDSIAQYKGLSNKLVKSVIRREEINTLLYDRNGKPLILKLSWDSVRHEISQKYGEKYANEIIYEEEPKFLIKSGDWNAFTTLYDIRISTNRPTKDGFKLDPLGDAWGLNSIAWELFERCDDTSLLVRGLRWVEIAVQLAPENAQILDTRANLLYKIGRYDEALKQEQAAFELSERQAKALGQHKSFMHDEFEKTLKKMKNHEKTWPVN